MEETKKIQDRLEEVCALCREIEGRGHSYTITSLVTANEATLKEDGHYNFGLFYYFEKSVKFDGKIFTAQSDAEYDWLFLNVTGYNTTELLPVKYGCRVIEHTEVGNVVTYFDALEEIDETRIC